MEREETDPPRRHDGILMRMITTFCDLVGNVMDGNDTINEDEDDEHQYRKSEIVEKHGFHRPFTSLMPFDFRSRPVSDLLRKGRPSKPDNRGTLY